MRSATRTAITSRAWSLPKPGIPPEEARKRVDATIEQAKQAANTARKAAAGIAFLIGALSMFAAGAAYWAAMAGGRERDENVWR